MSDLLSHRLYSVSSVLLRYHFPLNDEEFRSAKSASIWALNAPSMLLATVC